MTTKTILTCAFCRFWYRFDKDTLYESRQIKGISIGHCRIDQPKVTGEGTHWPMTFENDWCGKYESKPPPPRQLKPDYRGEDNPPPQGEKD